VNRTWHRAESAAALAGEAGRAGNPRDVSDADLVVQATSMGLGQSIANEEPDNASARGAVPPFPVDPDFLRPGQLVVDLVYDPPVTPFLAAARKRGARTLGGLGMLVHQAARAIELWTGRVAPLEEIWKVASESEGDR
jgi:shikimate dehydrogenase